MRIFLQGRVELVRQLILTGPEVAYADLMLILTAVLSACAAARWPGTGIDRRRFVELLVRHSPPDARAAYISIAHLLSSGDVSEDQTPWGSLGESTRIFRDDEIDLDVANSMQRYPGLTERRMRSHCYAAMIYEWLRCGYAHEYCPHENLTTVPPSRDSARISYIGRRSGSGIVRIASFHLEYMVNLAAWHADHAVDAPEPPPQQWWIDGG